MNDRKFAGFPHAVLKIERENLPRKTLDYEMGYARVKRFRREQIIFYKIVYGLVDISFYEFSEHANYSGSRIH